MQWSNVKLIYLREMRDQFRDRRTLFLIAVLPLLLYPLLGMSFFQLAQFMRNESPRVLLVGEEELAGHDWLPPLVGPSGDEFAPELERFADQRGTIQLLHVADFAEAPELKSRTPRGSGPVAETERLHKLARRLLDEGRVQAVLCFPKNLGTSLESLRQAMQQRTSDNLPPLPELLLMSNLANEKSRLAHQRLERVVETWRNQISQSNLAAGEIPPAATLPFSLSALDLAPPAQKRSAAWSKILPFVVFIWALTGAFYPAVDLCAGEKERGTLETLLTSPALRREIVWGKLLTVMSFSMATAVLNLASLGLTAKFVLGQFTQMGLVAPDAPLTLPSLAVMGWLIVGLAPISALFSALCLACAALARSTKEGQYYLMPLMLVTMPLMLLPMSPGVELDLGNSLIPLTGLVLLLKAVLEGQYLEALRFAVPVAGITLMAALLAIRWAEEQFNRESVLFRESERLELGRWLVHLVRDRGETPSAAQSVLCIAVIIVVQFFVTVAAVPPREGITFPFFAQMAFISQAVCILTPAALMALLLTGNPRKTLLLDQWPRISHIAAAMLLAVALHPLSLQMVKGIQLIYPLGEEVLAQNAEIERALGNAPQWWWPYLLIALLPAVCEEIAFRGFILSGLRRIGHKWWAIGFSAVAFGAVHLFLQQKITAAVIGLAIGFLAVQSGRLWTCMAFHATHNGLQLLAAKLSEPDAVTESSFLFRFYQGDAPLVSDPAILAICGLVAMTILWGFHWIGYQRTDEERLQEARERHGTLAPSEAAG
ncbi:MAG: CPBP family intramembrane metalloprotease [Pirellulales bacterium]|nr:CPBP family intramembrane metalloprotease [Pirellulales bacterium]